MLNDKGLFGMRTTNPLRRACIILMNTQLFNTIVLITIGINCIFLSTETNNQQSESRPAFFF